MRLRALVSCFLAMELVSPHDHFSNLVPPSVEANCKRFSLCLGGKVRNHAPALAMLNAEEFARIVDWNSSEFG